MSLDKWTQPKTTTIVEDSQPATKTTNIVKENEKILTTWLDRNFRHTQTKMGYRCALLYFANSVYGDSGLSIHNLDEPLAKYLSEEHDFLDDFKRFILSMDEQKVMPMSIHNYAGVVRKFFSRHGLKITEEEWKDMATIRPPNVVSTQDDIPRKEQLRLILNHLNIAMKALTLFLTSSGARIGETLALRIDDFDLDTDPPSANIRGEYTKKGVGKRKVWFSYEARDALYEWFRIKDTRKKKGHGGGVPFAKEMAFGFTYGNYAAMWGYALKKARLDKHDPTTNIKIYHIHTLRKYFSTLMSEASVPESIIHAWQGHKAYLDDAYKKIQQGKTGRHVQTEHEHSSNLRHGRRR